ncbi:MAG: hypothetical protein R2794_11810 [Chitinophagales bacterium]
MHLRNIIVSAVLCTCLFSCDTRNEQIGHAIYHWQSDFSLSEQEKSILQDAAINKIYLRFFDVAWDRAAEQPLPVSELYMQEPLPAGTAYVPVVFITNEVMEKCVAEDVPVLAQKISKRIEQKIIALQLPATTEIQIDCDWTKGTRDAYFTLLEKLREVSALKDIQWSATIRLHQIKYKDETGVPPVDRGTLMFYNMGNIEDAQSEQSIYTKKIADGYVAAIPDYPLPLDVAIACFSWGLLFHENTLLHIFYPLDAATMASDSLFAKKEENVFVAKRETYFRGYFITPDDPIKIESMDPARALQSAKQVSKYLPAGNRDIILYQLDADMVRRFSAKEMEEIYGSF